MAANSFNSITGFSSGIPPVEVVNAAGNVITNVLTSGNVAAGNIYSDNYKYANGVRFELLPAGNATQVQYNTGGELDASPNFTFESTSNTLTVTNIETTTQTTGNAVVSYDGNQIATTSAYSLEISTSQVFLVLWTADANTISGADFTIVATDSTANTRQLTKISSAILGTTVTYDQYSNVAINGGTGGFMVNYFTGNLTVPPSLELLAEPNSTNTVLYNITITQYL